jgi:hypothetical protein
MTKGKGHANLVIFQSRPAWRFLLFTIHLLRSERALICVNDFHHGYIMSEGTLNFYSRSCVHTFILRFCLFGLRLESAVLSLHRFCAVCAFCSTMARTRTIVAPL